MKTFVLSTCGTSIVTNGISSDLRKVLNTYTNYQDWQAMPVEVAEQLKTHFDKREKELLVADDAMVCRMSAELNGLLTWQKEHNQDEQDVYALLATDTIFGKTTAGMIKSWLEQKGHQVILIESFGVNTSGLAQFREGLSGLVKTLIETLEGYKASEYRILFNLTGGFKSLNGLLQAMSTIYADETFYLFEGSQDLLYIPKLPFQLNAKDIIEQHLHAFRRLNQGLAISDEEKMAIPDSLLFSIDDEVILSEWGELLWQNSYKDIYKSSLLSSISNRIIYADGFEDSTKKLKENILVIVNQHIAELAKYAEGDCKLMTKSLDAKPLQEKRHKSVNRWECDLDDHFRIFMIKDGYTFTLEKVDKAFH